jgi:WD40 repeat protein
MRAEMRRDCPYMGLLAYDEQDAPFFFGRDKETRLITANLFAAPLTLLFGASGVGKSSVLRAGVIHDLRERAGVTTVYFDAWQGDALEALKHAVARCVDRSGEWARTVSASMPFRDLLKECARRLDSHLMIILDQFEEYFLYQTSDGVFATQFPAALVQTGSEVSFLVSIREEALAKLDRFEGRVPNLFGNRLPIERLRADAARYAITGPIDAFSARCGTKYGIEAELVDEVLRTVKPAAASVKVGDGQVMSKEDDGIEAPYLQLVMTRLWDEEMAAASRVLRRQTLNGLGGAQAIVRKHLDERMDKLQPEGQEVAAKIFQFLVTPDGRKVAHTADTLAAWSGLDKDKVERVLEDLAGGKSRILRALSAYDRPGVIQYEIFHDVLARAVLDWEVRYSKEKERREAETRLASFREKARKARRLARIYFIVMVVIILLSASVVGLVIYGLRERAAFKRAQDDAARAQEDAAFQRSRSELALIDLEQRKIPFLDRILRGHRAEVNAAAFSPDGRLIVTASADGTARLWDLTSAASQELAVQASLIKTAAFSPDGRQVVTSSTDGIVRLWEVDTLKNRELSKGASSVSGAVFSPDGRFVAAGDADSVRVWDIDGGPSREFRGHRGPVNIADCTYVIGGRVISGAFTRDSRLLVTGSADGTARVWDIKTGQSKRVFAHRRAPDPGDNITVTSAAFSPDGRFVVTASSDKTARIWEISTRRSLVLEGHSRAVNSAVFSPNGEFVATSSDDRTARIWNATTGRLAWPLEGHTESVVAASFNWDGQELITASRDGTARVWEAGTGQRLAQLRGHTGAVNTAAWGPDGRLAVTASSDGTVRVWDTSDLGGFHVARVSLGIDPSKYSGPCPGTIRLTGAIEVAGGGGTVRYKFVRDNGTEGKENTLTFDSPGSKPVSTTWAYGGPNYPLVSGSFHIQIVAPNSLPSNEAAFDVNCENPAEVTSLEAPQGLEASRGPGDGSAQVTQISLKWLAVPGASKYRVEVEYLEQPYSRLSVDSESTSTMIRNLRRVKVRWRVFAIDHLGQEGKKSEWRYVNLL